jgi:protocatechuate 3,4-dioxygenase beta subunit
MRMNKMRLATLVTLFVTGATLSAQDTQFLQAVERAQQQRPSAIGSTARIAPVSESGTPLVLSGRIAGLDGRPLANAIVFAYHTDKNGLYDARDKGPHSWRLKGWARSDPQGRFTFETIRPGSYPNERNPAHVHFTAFTANGERYHAGEVQFSDDPLLSSAQRQQSERDGEFGPVRPVRTEGGTQKVDFALRLKSSDRF